MFFIQTENDDSLLFSWIYYCFFTILDDVRLGSTKWCRYYLLCMNDTRVRCASGVMQRNLCKMMYGCLGIFSKNISIFLSLLIVAFFSCKEISVQPKCLVEKQRTETHSTGTVYIYPSSSWGASMATKCFLLIHVSFKVVIFVLDNRKPLHPPPPPPNVCFSKQ